MNTRLMKDDLYWYITIADDACKCKSRDYKVETVGEKWKKTVVINFSCYVGF